MELSLYEYLQNRHRDVLRRFMEELGGVAGAVLDEDKRIVVCNSQFAQLAGLGEPTGTALSEFAAPVQGSSILLPPDGAAWNVTFHLTNRTQGVEECKMHVFHEEGEYLLLCDELVRRDDRAVVSMARLNDELTDLNRELEKKTRALEKANKTIKRMARTDPLTELANRRHFQEEMETRLSEAGRHEFPVAVAMGDLDHFKGINDTFGHDAGDKVLKLFAKILKDSCRKEDLPARWGGEEFIVLMPHTSAEEGYKLTERVRQALEESSIPEIDRAITASFGVAEFQRGDDANSLVTRADGALYEAKESGRNRVAVAGDSTG
jgi:diguanylate cyclase (GGDEF)-like protein